ncbi:MAG: hypothetical protein ACPGTQ_10300 [Colwellia sp.]
MIKVNTFVLLGTCAVLVGCTNQNAITQQNVKPVTNACQKIDLLIKASHNDFDGMKLSEVKSKSTRIWKAKYDLVGDNCQIWTLGSNELTYSCRLDTDNETLAQQYYSNAKKTTSHCLDQSWKMVEEDRVHDEGKKAIFTKESESTNVSTHIVPSRAAFKDMWTVYYYIGASK